MATLRLVTTPSVIFVLDAAVEAFGVLTDDDEVDASVRVGTPGRFRTGRTAA